MNKTKKQSAILRILTSLLLVFIMSLGIAPNSMLASNSTNTDLAFNEDDFPIDPPQPVIEKAALPEMQRSDSRFYQSERRLMYQQLLEGNYPAVEMNARFQEIFGVHSATYIRENFTDLFNITDYEIDEGLLNIIAPMRVWRMEQVQLSHHENFLRFGNDRYDFITLDFEEDLLAHEIEEGVFDEISFEVPFLETDNQHIEFSNFADISGFSSSNDVSIRLISANNTSITVELFFNPAHFNGNNLLRYYDFTAINPGFNGAWLQAARPFPAGTNVRNSAAIRFFRSI